MSTGEIRLRVEARGAVQGVGFRPFVQRLADELGLPGWVRNAAYGVEIEVEGSRERLDDFLARLRTDKPPLAFYEGVEHAYLGCTGFREFQIRESDDRGALCALVMPDIATCGMCLAEMRDPANRRYRYPFLNCTHCGPRYSIIERLPYDRRNTTMSAFRMCEACRAEYGDPRDRRFHAQPIACPECGPRLAFWDGAGRTQLQADEALVAAAAAVRAGRIVAVKGVGGFQLVCDARNADAVGRLRARKVRPEKPFAIMAPSLDAVRVLCELTRAEEALLASPAAPIVLLRWREHGVCEGVAPRLAQLGVMLPYTPLHHLLMDEWRFPVVATSGNLAEEPICTDEREALQRLGGIADAFLVHDRPIARHVDDSVVRVIADRATVLRRARGFAPLPVRVGVPLRPVVAAGAHRKNTVAVTLRDGVVLSPHVGDLETVAARAALARSVRGLQALYDVRAEAAACDAHPDYASTAYARASGLPVVTVQHHVAHVLACMAENEVEVPALGVGWDGAGWGTDRTIWGGEFLLMGQGSWERYAHLRTFPLPGGERAMREPRRALLGLVFEALGDALPAEATRHFRSEELRLMAGLLRAGVNCPRTSSIGRLFDAVAALTGLQARCSYEGQAAMALECAAEKEGAIDEAYPLRDVQGVLDWEPMLRALLEDLRQGVSAGRCAARFHNALALAIAGVARRAGLKRVVLSGGCFQNRLLTERAVQALEAAGCEAFRHQRVPPNDGGIALGQAVAAGR